MTEHYESPEVKPLLTKEDIRERYQDTSLVIFKEQQNKKEIVNYLTFGTSRRTMEYSSYGNQPVIVRRPAGSLTIRNDGIARFSEMLTSMHRKPRDSCTIS
ncbi:putative uncharacterized protein BRD3OS [Ceratina calcarata]|uniref:Uncharacterized protein n=1 Tax=Ceratina calcarata TaxID=156304 RepID=A0AAJ7J2D2_9HYME|nr:putative uncharacterized protein BRD3OS [Ceratina calcarata]XP_017882452.1 putative uncharacterized protein BRD3OS [Ceratina calcarata]XP_017882453.1 putative uncharacterized protein BRD3OS [Ceratina calcarata]XP_026670566.1 putative uncharacterized protein BRD3OS [Ceratina calcarata]XP_026670567.1 putative uncharacterized protein BRD3OS [Ceratina calcarata]